MSEDGLSERALTRAELATLAELFDKSELAFDPRSTAARSAESEFENQTRLIYEQKVHPHYASVSFTVFKNRVKTLCRQFLRKNAP